MAIASRQPEITVKFSELPSLPAEGKKATVEFVSESGLTVAFEVTRKNAAKQLKRTEGFEDWVGSASGKIEKVESNLIVAVTVVFRCLRRNQSLPRKIVSKRKKKNHDWFF